MNIRVISGWTDPESCVQLEDVRHVRRSSQTAQILIAFGEEPLDSGRCSDAEATHRLVAIVGEVVRYAAWHPDDRPGSRFVNIVANLDRQDSGHHQKCLVLMCVHVAWWSQRACRKAGLPEQNLTSGPITSGDDTPRWKLTRRSVNHERICVDGARKLDGSGGRRVNGLVSLGIAVRL